jgi:hypothetical protein
MTDSELVPVKTFLSRTEADLAKSALEAAGIEALVSADDAGGMRPSLWMGGVTVLVRSDDRDQARKILGAA